MVSFRTALFGVFVPSCLEASVSSRENHEAWLLLPLHKVCMLLFHNRDWNTGSTCRSWEDSAAPLGSSHHRAKICEWRPVQVAPWGRGNILLWDRRYGLSKDDSSALSSIWQECAQGQVFEDPHIVCQVQRSEARWCLLFHGWFPHDIANTITVMYKTLLKVTIYFVLLLVFLITHKWNCLMVILNPPLAYYKYRNLRGGAVHQILFTFKLTTHAVRTRTSMSLDFASGQFTLDLLRRSDFHFCLSGKTLATNGRKHTYWLTSELCTIFWRYLGNGFTHSD